MALGLVGCVAAGVRIEKMSLLFPLYVPVFSPRIGLPVRKSAKEKTS